jgi:hypothetical protein
MVSQAYNITRYVPKPEFCFILSSVIPDHFVLTAGSIILTAIPNGSTLFLDASGNPTMANWKAWYQPYLSTHFCSLTGDGVELDLQFCVYVFKRFCTDWVKARRRFQYAYKPFLPFQQASKYDSNLSTTQKPSNSKTILTYRASLLILILNKNNSYHYVNSSLHH